MSLSGLMPIFCSKCTAINAVFFGRNLSYSCTWQQSFKKGRFRENYSFGDSRSFEFVLGDRR